jgi:hypothetical protein
MILAASFLSGISFIETHAQEDAIEFEYDEDTSYFEVLDTISALASNGNVTSISADPDFYSIILTLETNSSDGTLDLVLPRNAIDSKDGNEDSKFTVVVDATEVSYTETRTSETERDLEILIPAGTQQVEIIGTQVVPEFPLPLLMVVLSLGGVMVATRVIKSRTKT